MEYYYLDSSRTPRGPYSREALLSMLSEGIISYNTEIASKGDASWQPLEVVFSDHPAMEIFHSLPTQAPKNGTAGHCPSCRAEIEATDGKLPEACPSCGYTFPDTTRGYFHNIFYALKHTFDFRGRATRAEFWQFSCTMAVPSTLASILYIGFLILAMVFPLLCQVKIVDDDGTPLPTPVESLQNLSLGSYILTAVFWLLFVLTSVPMYSVLARRIHDIGRSAKWLFLVVFINLCTQGINLAEIIGSINAAVPSSFDNLYELAQNIQQEITARQNTQFSVLSIISSLLSLINFAFSIAIIVMACTDSQRGPNKYGPSSKYPLG